MCGPSSRRSLQVEVSHQGPGPPGWAWVPASRRSQHFVSRLDDFRPADLRRCHALSRLRSPEPAGADECERCQTPLAALDAPTPMGRSRPASYPTRFRSSTRDRPSPSRTNAELGEAIRAMIDQRVERGAGHRSSRRTRRHFDGGRFSDEGGRRTRYEAAASGRFHDTCAGNGSPDRLLAAALAKMDAGGYRHLPVFSKECQLV